jgi:hypothetical protein
VKRANTFFPTTPATASPTPEKSSKINFPGKAGSAVAAVQPAAHEALVKGPVGSEVADASRIVSGGQPVPPDDEVASVNRGAAPAAALKKTADAPPNLWAILGVPWAVGIALVVVQWSLLRGRA